jgi:hypothetical protein
MSESCRPNRTLMPLCLAPAAFLFAPEARAVAIDPTLALAEASEVPPGYLAPVVDRFVPQARRRLLDRFWIPSPEGAAHRDEFLANGMGFVRAAHETRVVVAHTCLTTSLRAHSRREPT